jgi:hypothetical protein
LLNFIKLTPLGAYFLVDLLALLKWKAFPDRIMDILGRLRHVSGEEIVKVCHSPSLSTLSKAEYGQKAFPVISAGKPLRPFLQIHNG